MDAATLKLLLDAVFETLEKVFAKSPLFVLVLHAVHIAATSDAVLAAIASLFAFKQAEAAKIASK